MKTLDPEMKELLIIFEEVQFCHGTSGQDLPEAQIIQESLLCPKGNMVGFYCAYRLYERPLIISEI